MLFSRERPTLVGMGNLTTVFLDQYTGEVLPTPPRVESVGDRILAWAGPLHIGGFGGWAIKTIWLIAGLAPTILFITGFITWWRRAIRPAYATSTSLSSESTIPG